MNVGRGLNRQHDDYGARVIYSNGNGHSPMVNWLLGMAATIITASIVACAALLWNLNATTVDVVARLAAVERTLDRMRP